MSRRVLVVGIGSGSPDLLTERAVRALNEVDLFLVADKGQDTRALAALRADLCRAVITHDRYRILEVPDPPRGRDGSYLESVADWHARRARLYADLIQTETEDDQAVGLLVWGDPAIYDSTLRIVEQVQNAGLDLSVEVIPGISSIQLLAARHRMVLNTVGGSIHLTTGRRLLAEFDPSLGTVVVLLDADLSCAGLLSRHPDLEIAWGAQLGLPDEALVRGRLADVVDEIRDLRARLRARRGWVMDTYLLRG